jgi:hypothetical protein
LVPYRSVAGFKGATQRHGFHALPDFARLRGNDAQPARRLDVIPVQTGIHAFFHFKIKMLN